MKRQAMEKKYSSNFPGKELMLFHGTSSENVEKINSGGLNRSYAGIHGNFLQTCTLCSSYTFVVVTVVVAAVVVVVVVVVADVVVVMVGVVVVDIRLLLWYLLFQLFINVFLLF